ncbi:hypothetical protein LCL87_07800 [Rhodococcus hoagii]|nr:hypothetical protein [Prescottella equi]
MRARHKNQNAYVEISSAMPIHQLAEVCIGIATSVRTSPTLGQVTAYGIEYLGGDPSVLHFMVRRAARGGQLKFEVMPFHVSVGHRVGGSYARSEIDGATVSQDSFLFVPIGPKQLHGYPAYKAFMNQFAFAAKQADPHAQAVVSEFG